MVFGFTRTRDAPSNKFTCSELGDRVVQQFTKEPYMTTDNQWCERVSKRCCILWNPHTYYFIIISRSLIFFRHGSSGTRCVQRLVRYMNKNSLHFCFYPFVWYCVLKCPSLIRRHSFTWHFAFWSFVLPLIHFISEQLFLTREEQARNHDFERDDDDDEAARRRREQLTSVKSSGDAVDQTRFGRPTHIEEAGLKWRLIEDRKATGFAPTCGLLGTNFFPWHVNRLFLALQYQARFLVTVYMRLPC